MKTQKDLEDEMIREEYEKGKPYALIIAIILAYVITGIGLVTLGYYICKLIERFAP